MMTSNVNFITLNKEGLFDLFLLLHVKMLLMMEKAAADFTQADWRQLQFDLCLTCWNRSNPSSITLTLTKFIVGIF